MRARLFACLFLVPVLALTVSFSIEAVFNLRLKEPVLRMHPEATASEMAKVNVRALCAKNIPQLRGICSIYQNLTRMRYAACGLAALGIFALLGFGAAKRAEEERQKRFYALLARLRFPVLAVYAPVHFALAAASLYYASVGAIGSPGPVLISVTVLLPFIGVGAMSLHLKGLMKKASPANLTS